MNLKKIVAGTAVAGALGFTAFGVGAGVANADPSAPVVARMAWQQDRGHGHGDGDHGDWGDRGDWRLPPWWWWVPPPPPPPWGW
jgi:hypothetical protein